MKGKATITITVGLMCLILMAVMFTQFKTISKINVTELENMREDELRKEITNWKTKQEELEKKLEETNIKIDEYNETITDNRKASQLLNEELNQLAATLGQRDVRGSGIIVTVSDYEQKVEPYDLIGLINELKLAGAEAISINDQRIVYESYIVDVGGLFISVNGEKEVSPYVVKAIGNPTYLESGLSKKQYGYVDSKNAEGISVTLKRQDNIYISKYNKDLNFERVK